MSQKLNLTMSGNFRKANSASWFPNQTCVAEFLTKFDQSIQFEHLNYSQVNVLALDDTEHQQLGQNLLQSTPNDTSADLEQKSSEPQTDHTGMNVFRIIRPIEHSVNRDDEPTGVKQQQRRRCIGLLIEANNSRRRKIKNPVMGNNPYGKVGTWACRLCRQRRWKVSNLPVFF
jgi:hypothetical protein